MGFLRDFATGWSAYHEEARAEQLHHDLGVTIEMVQALPQELCGQTLAKFREMRREMSHDMQNWSRDGALKVAKNCFEVARARQDLDRRAALSLALLGLWLESGLRSHPKAVVVREYLDGLVNQLDEAANG